MKKIMLFVFGAFFCFLPSIGQTTTVSCPSQSLQTAINSATPGDTLKVTGTCNENVTVKDGHSYITLDGQNFATIHAKDATQPSVEIFGQSVTIKNFVNITGGLIGVFVLYGGSTAIDHNIISGNQYGVGLFANSNATITNSTIGSNTEAGIVVWEHSSAYIGVTTPFDTIALPNTIQHNGNTSDNRGGVWVTQSSSAVIVGNTVSNNTGPGIKVDRGSQADISDNHINGNSTNGIGVAHNSGVNLGNKIGTPTTTIFDLPNFTGTNNAMRGISCTIGGYVDGLIGTLNGNQGTTLFTNGCFSAL